MAAPAAVLSILLKANTGGATTALLRFNQQLDSTEKHSHKAARAIETVAKTGALIGGAAVIGGLTYAAKKAADFEQQMSSLGAVADASGRQMEQFRKQAMKAGADTKFSALEAAQAQTELAKGGLTVKQIMRGGLRSALALAAAGELELGDAATYTVNAMKLFGLRGRDSMKVADALATAANRTTADVADFGMALTQGGGAAKAAGLSFTQTVTVLEALAEVGVKNSDAGTSMKTALLQLIGPTNKQADAAKRAGVNFLDQHGRMKDIADISEMLRAKTAGMTKAQRAALFQTLAGTDGFRTLLALYDAGPKKLEGMEKGLNKQGTAADVAKKKQDNLKGSLEQLGGSIETLGIQVGTLLLPAIRKGADELTGLANQIGKILARDDLTLGEKLQRSLDVAKVRIDPWIDKLKDAIDRANIPEKLGAVISAATPVIVKAAAVGGIAAAKTFAGAFASSDVWGKLVLGGWLLSRMGGKAAWFKMGGEAGASFGAGMATTGGAGGAFGLVGKLKGALGGLKGLAGRLLAVDVGVNLIDSKGNVIAAAINTAHDLTFGIVPKVHVTTGGEKVQASVAAITKQLDSVTKARDVGGLTNVVSKIRAMADEARDFGKADLGKQLDKLADKGEKTAGRLSASQHEVAGMSDRFAANIRGLRLKGSKSFDELVQNVTFGARQILKQGDEKSTDTRKAIAKQFRIARDRVKEAMHDKIISVKEGTEKLHDLAVKELALYGIKAGRVNVVLAKGANGQMRPTQRGGHINEGAPTGDSVPSLLERGEYVLNRNAVRKIGKQQLDRLNFAGAPRFQSGGMVAAANRLNEAQFPYVWGGGHQASPAPFGPMDCSGAVSFVLQHGGVKIPTMVSGALASAGKPGPGPVTVFANAVHTFMRLGGRYFGTSGSNPGGGAGWFPAPPASYLARFTQRHFDAGSMLSEISRVMLEGPPSVALEAGQGALDRVRGAANASIAALASTPIGAGDAGDPGPMSGSGAALMKAISKARGWNFSDWWALDASETSHGANLANPTSTARLRGQFLRDNWGKYGPGSDPAANPSMAQQIQSMAQYIGERYGNPSAAWAFHQAHNWYQQGGVVGLRAGGAPNTASGVGNASRPGTATPGGVPTGTIADQLAKTIGKVRTGKSPKIRGAAVKRLLDRIKDIGLPAGVADALKLYSTNSGVFGEYADRAGSLTDEGVISEALQAELERRMGKLPPKLLDELQKIPEAQQAQWLTDHVFPAADQQSVVEQMLGRVGGKSQLEWLTDQLGALFNWRNTIIDAEKIVVSKRDKTTGLIETARTRLGKVREAIRAAAATRKTLAKQLETAQKHPKRNRKLIRTLRGQIHDIDVAQRPRIRVRDALHDKIIPALVDKRGRLTTFRGDLLGNLQDVQGVGAPMDKLASLPTAGVLGGRIFDAQMLVKDLTDKPIRVMADVPTQEAAGESESASILAELLRQANLRTAVSEAQFKVFQGVGNMQQFATGGIVQGSPGQAVPAVVHAGEGVFTRDQMAAMGGGSGIRVIVHGDIISDRRDPIEVLIGDRRFDAAVERSTRKLARSARSLPGRSGSLK